MVQERTAEPEATAEELSWKARRASEQKSLAALVVIFELVLSVGVYFYYGLSYALLAFGVITLALIPFYASYRYVLRRDGLEIHGPFYFIPHPWTRFEGWRLSQNELRLVPAKGSVVVLFAPHNMNEVVQFVQGSLPQISDHGRRL